MFDFPKKEEEILKFWQDNRIFEKTLEKTKGKKTFVFYDGPPFATGAPHYGHLLQSAIKDAIPRYKTMQGFYVERQWGWDCHGLPIENIVEKNLGTKNKKEIVQMGVKKFNDLCREQIFTFINEWEKIIPRFGRWADMKNPYRTMDFEYMQAEWKAFKELYKKGLIYEGKKSMHICPRCETTLSQGEVADGYKDIKDLSGTFKFKLSAQGGPASGGKNKFPENTYFLAWTTTPWTLPGNSALAVGEKVKYVLANLKNENYILAEERVKDIFNGKEYKVVKEFKGRDLVGLEYEPLFDNYIRSAKVYSADFVNTEDGTGIVHIAPAFGADDMELGKQKNLPFIQHVKMDGTFGEDMGELSGTDLKSRAKNKTEEIREADLTVVKLLEKKGLLFEYKKYEHSYPHCWRCDTALLNYATSSWFVAVEKIKPLLLKTAKKINWSPSHIKEGRFGQWLKGARDWSISRQRFWANTIPVWRCKKCNKEFVFGSAKELEEKSGTKISDLHKDFVDEIIFGCECGGEVQRIPDVLDTWFDSGSVPFATNRPMPADFIGEAQDQTRAWFYYQHVLVGALFSKEAFKNCIVTGIVLAEDGKKMSKKLKNYPDPAEIIEKYGADATRFYMLNSPVVQADNFSFSEKGVDEIVKKNISRLYNVFSFYKLYDNNTLSLATSKNKLDKWIISRLNNLIKDITDGYENYRLDLATRPLTDFIDDLSVWYLRRSRERFKEENNDKKDALGTLRYVLLNTAFLMAPTMPFFAEYLFEGVREKSNEESVHLMGWPKYNKKLIDKQLEEDMAEVRNIVNLALAERVANNLKVRQPLTSLKVKSKKLKVLSEELMDLVKDEVNVKEILFIDKIEKEVELDTNLTEELKEEGILREIIRFVQGARKDADLKPFDNIIAYFTAEEPLVSIINKYKENLLKEITAQEIKLEEGQDINFKKDIIIEGKKLSISIKKE
ncbi:MAG: isoleucine--tRNA ligase [Candidatus Staskawiczbacteria bacterium]|nr:isoleucine--tRNA ligase [Candidatus Staskawiczbacteria bacterium]